MNQKNDKLPFETEKEYKLRRLLEWADRRGLTQDIHGWTINELGIFELKRGHSLKASPIVSILRNLKIRQRGMSKYCTGRALLESGLKQNAFKPRLRFLHKEIFR